MPETVTKEPIAIIGYGCVLPDAPDVPTFWNNLLEGKNSIREVPHERWDPAIYWTADKSVPDRTYAKIGAFVMDDGFNGLDFRMPPNVVAQVDPCQRWALSATKQAFEDAGLSTGLRGDAGREFDRERCAVIIGNAMGGELQKHQHKRIVWAEVEAALRSDPDFLTLSADQQSNIIERVATAYKRDTNPVTEDTMPGHLSNVIAGRVANAFNLGGKNFTTDAACASSLAALDAAMDSLRKGEADAVVWGGTDRSMDVSAYVQFSKIGALSPDGSRPFDKGANGFVMGEGCAMFILKRLSDAERDGDHIHGIVRGIGGSSDGKGKGITAPNPIGQIRAVERAFVDAECELSDVGYLEAHGTSTPVGDPVELESVMKAAAKSATPPTNGSILVGSAKSNVGHLKAGAGAVGMLKAILAVEHGVVPPSINVTELNPRIDWANSPFTVATQRTEWPSKADQPRRAAVSSFGFGGTNFHVVVQEFIPGALVKADPLQTQSHVAPATPAAPVAATPTSSEARMTETFDEAAFRAHMETAAALEAQSVVLDADALPGSIMGLPTVTYADNGQGPRIRDLFRPITADGVNAERRVGLAVQSIDEIPKKLELAQKAATNPAVAKLAFQQGVFINQGKPQGKVAFLFPGQGTQYVNMGRDLAKKYAIVRNTFEEADDILFDELGGVKLTDILWPTPNTPANQKASNEKLKLTEFTQPAVLAMDVAILRLLNQWNIKPDVVAGHSLGEYGALVAAGVLSLGDALHAVAARGREMANVDLPDLGKMASIPADWETVSKALERVDDYVICANKNCPSQTVIAGSSTGVDKAVELLTSQGLQCMFLPVSAAFHSSIVAPASKPLRNVLARLNVQSPKVRCLTNVGAVPYPDDPEAIRDNLATQVASPVEWIGIIERMRDEGVTTFIEVGPKKALTGFCMDILQDTLGKEQVAVCSNHPKKGEIQHINELFAFLGAWGFQPQMPDLNDGAMYTSEFRDPKAAFTRRATAPSATNAASDARIDAIERAVASMSQQIADLTGKPAPAAIVATPETAPRVAAPATPASAVTASEDTALAAKARAFGLNLDDIGVSGISVGLPGVDKPLFADDNWDRILRGDNLIDPLPESEKKKLAGKNIVRLVKGGDGQASFQIINDIAQVIQLAGRRGSFDVTEWGVEGDFASTLDRTFQYAIAAGLEALRDAGIPLQRTYLKTTTGSYLPKEWKLPEPLRDETGIVFASAFPGYDNLLRDVSQFLADKYAGRTLDELQRLYTDLLGAIDDPALKDKMGAWFEGEFHRLQDVLPDHGAKRYEFNRKFLFNVLSMGHAQLAQFIGARGPNTQLNAACASTTQAIAVAEDWIRTGRCKRVLVVGADDVTSDAMFEWVGSGFLASGAATTKADVAEAALPFDARRHGMIVGMGAVGLVVESAPEVEARGMRPIAKLLATSIANSAFHGSRLDIDHISAAMKALTEKAQARYGIEATRIAAKTIFVSHETYTPARGGSASAEIHALRTTFGDAADSVVIANTKGFTGHPQGAGIEDALALKMLQRGIVPPIANFRDPDPELGNLNLSKGGSYDVEFALRLAAGFGSQVAMTLTQLVARENERYANEATYKAWVAQISGLPGAELEVQNRTLRIVDQGAPTVSAEGATTPTPVPAATPAPTPEVATGAPSMDADAALAKVTGVIAEKTGYPAEMLEADLDMEADLGIDTVKQAELFGELREMFGVPMNEDLQLKDYNTLRKVASYMAGGSAETATPATTPTPAPATTPEAAPAAMVTTTSADADAALAKVTAVIAEKTGYPAEMLEADLDMEADLGIDTVKQAELFGELREMFGVPMNEDLQLKDYNTLRKVAQYMAGGSAETVSATTTATTAPAEPAPTTAPTPSATGGDVDAALTKVTELVAEKTGYPSDMLEPDLDMEADLGIDTVKQAELFGELREHFGVPMREDLQIADYNTLRKVAEYMSGSATTAATPESTTPSAPAPAASAPAASAPAPATAAADAPKASKIEGDAALQTVTELVAQKTGYPAEMLEADLDMEADLGIDTVKQAELFGELREMFSVPLREDLQIADYNTLRKVADYMAAASSRSTAQATGQTTAPIEAPTTATEDRIVRRTPMPRAEASPDTANAITKGELLVVGDADASVMDAFKAEGFAPSPQAKQPVGILCIATRPGDSASTRAGALFDAAKGHREAMGEGSLVCIVTSQDGAHGCDRVRDAPMAAITGLGKALKKEFPEAVTKVIDIHPDFKGGPSAAATECLNGGTRTEICFAKDGGRHVIDVIEQPLTDATVDVTRKHLVVSGGAQGITVEMLAALAPQGPRLTLLGRTAVPAEAETWATYDDARWRQEEQATMARMKDAGEKVTPVSLQKAMSPMKKAAEVQRNLQRLTDLGAEVFYAPVDVTDTTRVSEAIAAARDAFGPVAGIIHAAGVEISKDLDSKDRAQFDLVFGIKHDGLHALLAAVGDDALEWLASFGSVAGRFGNIGQVDYSAVNEYLCKAVKQTARERNIPTAFTIAWGPWGEVGMATKGSIMQIMEASGVTPIPTAEGVAQFITEMGTPGIRESVVGGRLGMIDADGQVIAPDNGSTDTPTRASEPLADATIEDVAVALEPAARFRLIDGIEAMTDRTVTSRVIMDQATQPYAQDHAIDNVPYLPGVFGLEAFAETCSLLAPELSCTKIEGASFGIPVKQLKGRPVTARVDVERISDDGDQEAVFSCRLTTRMVGPDGIERGEPRTHFEAQLTFGDAKAKQTDSVPPCTRELAADQIYPPFFHGPSFRVLRYAGPLEADESVAAGHMPYAAAFADGEPEYHMQPLIVEALFQLCGLRTMAVDTKMSLPAAIDSLEVFHHATISGEVRLWCQFTGVDDNGLRRFDAAACLPDGTVVMRMSGYGMVETGPAPAMAAAPIDEGPDERETLDVDNVATETDVSAEARQLTLGELPAPRKAPTQASLVAQEAAPEAEESVEEPAKEAAEETVEAPPAPSDRTETESPREAKPIPLAHLELPELDGIVFAAVAVDAASADDAWLTGDERATHAAFKVPKRAGEWLAGRLAAKAAILEAAPTLQATDIVIANDKGGAPFALVQDLRLPAALTITHRDGLAIAAVAEGPLGIDLETTEERAPSFHEEAFNAAERELAATPVGAACVWAAKEAVFKRIGTGLKQALHAWTVDSDGQGGATCNGPDGSFHIRFFDVEGRVLAVTAEAFDPLTQTVGGEA